MDNPKDANEECVGPQSDNAGKASSCNGCPNQSSCASGKFKGVDPDIENIKNSMKLVKRKILVLSGKGGVGKSTFSSQLAFALAYQGEEDKLQVSSNDVEEMDIDDEEENVTQVGLMDVDLCGPSIPTMMGIPNGNMKNTTLGMVPSYVQDNLAVVSIGFMIDKKAAVIWRGPRKSGLLKQFLRDVYWGDVLDYLIIDTPPGTSDEHITIVNYLKNNVDGAIIVTTPQDVSCQDVRKELNFCKKTKIPVLGVVENMSGFVCPKCNTKSEIFKKSKYGGGKKLAEEFSVPFLGSIPLDPLLMKCCENGTSIMKESPTSRTRQSFLHIKKQIQQQFN